MYSLTNTTSSETIEESLEPVSYNARMDLNARIFKARTDASMTQDELALAVGKTRSAVAQWESGDVRPRHSTILSIAKATNKPLHWLESGIGDEDSGMLVVGQVAAGLWKEGSLEFKPYGVPVAPHPDYPSYAQRLYQVVGNSVNRAVADGEYVHCVNVYDAKIKPENGDLVIVRRLEHGLSEYTAKRFVVDGERKLLRPESHDAQWQNDLVLDGDDDTSIEITDVVIAKWSPLRRRT